MNMENKKEFSKKGNKGKKSLESLIRTEDTSTTEAYEELNWSGTFWEYIELLENEPKIARNAYQRLYDMVISHGVNESVYCKRKYVRYKFFEGLGDVSIYGLEENLMEFMDTIKSASRHYGPERRVILLHGPVGSSKSTIVTALKKGLESYSQTQDGKLYSFSWKTQDKDGNEVVVPCPMNEEPLKLLPDDIRETIVARLNEKLEDSDYSLKLDGSLNPVNEFYYNQYME